MTPSPTQTRARSGRVRHPSDGYPTRPCRELMGFWAFDRTATTTVPKGTELRGTAAPDSIILDKPRLSVVKFDFRSRRPTQRLVLDGYTEPRPCSTDLLFAYRFG